MIVSRKRIGGGVEGRRLVKNMAVVLFVFSCNFHLVKYLCTTVMAWVSRRAMVSGLQDWGLTFTQPVKSLHFIETEG
jgi:hypothetical protein